MPATRNAGPAVEVHVMSLEAPVSLFVLGRTVFYRPTGNPMEDAALVAQGFAHLRAPPPSGKFVRPKF